MPEYNIIFNKTVQHNTATLKATFQVKVKYVIGKPAIMNWKLKYRESRFIDKITLKLESCEL